MTRSAPPPPPPSPAPDCGALVPRTRSSVSRAIRLALFGLGFLFALAPAVAQAEDLALGQSHSCVLDVAGGVRCWGSNASGQLGDGTTTNRSSPVPVAGLSSGALAVATGVSHSCAIDANGGVSCWGLNGYGQLGDGTTTNSSAPVAVSGLSSGVAAIAGGNSHTCALTDAGAVLCWGRNVFGSLGDGTTSDSPIPVAVSGLASGVAAIATYQFHTCALSDTGGVSCWGHNAYGQLGDGTTTNRTSPVAVSVLASGVAAIETGYWHSCALSDAGAVSCWGRNTYGQLGDGSTTQRTTPVAVSGLASGVAAIATGGEHSCALSDAGALSCWGRNGSGRLGDGTTTNRSVPTAVSGLSSGIESIAAGGEHTCARHAFGTLQVLCWGRNASGQLGDGTTSDRTTTVWVAGLPSDRPRLAAGGAHSCVVLGQDDVLCWGRNGTGQLGDGTSVNRLLPTAVSGLPGEGTRIEAGYWHSCALRSGGATCWGTNESGAIGDGTTTNRLSPTAVVGLASGVASLSSGFSHNCAVMTSGGVFCWGDNSPSGQLGVGSSDSRVTLPAGVLGLEVGIAAVAAGYKFGCALSTLGGIQCWGRNDDGQLGDGTTSPHSSPAPVTGLSSGIAAITASISSSAHSCALGLDGAVWCWGNNTSGQLGDGTTIQRPAPVLVDIPSGGFIEVEAGGLSNCGLTVSGGVWCWGDNGSGRLGNGGASYADQLTPFPVTGLDRGVVEIAVGTAHACALTASDGVWCWGENGDGQLGDGTTTDRSIPVRIRQGHDTDLDGVEDAFDVCPLIGDPGQEDSDGDGLGDACNDAEDADGDGWEDATDTCRLIPDSGQEDTDGDGVGDACNDAEDSDGDDWSNALDTCPLIADSGQEDMDGDGVGDACNDAEDSDGDEWSDALDTCLGVADPSNADADGDGVGDSCNESMDRDGDEISNGLDNCPSVSNSGQSDVDGDGLGNACDNCPAMANADQADANADGVGNACPVLSGIEAGSHHTCTFSADSTWCWGRNNTGQLGNGTTSNRNSPVRVSGIPARVDSMAAGSFHTCAVDSLGALWCWGDNVSGQLGDGTNTRRTVPTGVDGLSTGVHGIAAAGSHSCALTIDGGVLCWGANSKGQLGMGGDSTGVSSPVRVAGLTDGVLAIDAGAGDAPGGSHGGHSCVIATGGEVRCWGANFYSELGDGTTIERASPVDVEGLASGAIEINAGAYHVCVIDEDGGVRCWGRNDFGQLGAGTTSQYAGPVSVDGLPSAIIDIAVARSHTCALTSAGGVLCWGVNYYGNLGDGTTTNRSAPVGVVGLSSGVVDLAAGDYHTCALTDRSVIHCWGLNDSGQLGNGTFVNSSVPVVAGVDPDADGIQHEIDNCPSVSNLGQEDADGDGIGDACNQGEDGDGDEWSDGLDNCPLAANPGQEDTDDDGIGDACNQGEDGDGDEWSDGLDNCPLAANPGQEDTDGDGVGDVCSQDMDGDGWRDAVDTCPLVADTSNADTDGDGVGDSCNDAEDSDGDEWGDAFDLCPQITNPGQEDSDVDGVGDACDNCRFVPNPGQEDGDGDEIADACERGTNPGKITAGEAHACVATATGAAWCWGRNSSGQLGDGTLFDRTSAVRVSGLSSGVIDISAGGAEGSSIQSAGPSWQQVDWSYDGHNCALTSGGAVLCWGDNAFGQLGNGTTTDSPTPVNVSGLASGAVAIDLGGGHSCALMATGRVLCWGDNAFGQLGDGTDIARTLPVQVAGLEDVIAISAGGVHSCALTSAGDVHCWGSNHWSQLGASSGAGSTVPLAMSHLSGDVGAISAGGAHTCAMKLDGSVWCWGLHFSASQRCYFGCQSAQGTRASLPRRLPGEIGIPAAGGLHKHTAGILDAYQYWRVHSCALEEVGSVRCWGSNSFGQLGDGTTADHAVPVQVAGLESGVESIATGTAFSCALLSNGGVVCWGLGALGQIGNGSAMSQRAPVPVQASFDSDRDGRIDFLDNCPAVSNPVGEDTDGDGVGDACNESEDPDGDEWSNALDNCPAVANPDQIVGTPCQPFNWEGEAGLELARLGAESSAVLSGDGLAKIGVAGGAFPGHLHALRLQDPAFGGIAGTATVLVSDPALSGAGIASLALSNAAVGSGTLSPVSGGLATTGALLAKQLPLRGVLKLCLVDPACSSGELSFSLTAATSGTNAAVQGVGIGGTVSGTAQSFTWTTPPVQYTLEAAPWTLQTISISDQTGVAGSGTAAAPLVATATARGFAHGPASATSSTADVNGVVQFVSPVQIATNVAPTHPLDLAVLGATARLTIRFVPEPAALLGLAAAFAGLAALGRRRARR